MGSREIVQNFFIPEFWAKAFQGVLDFGSNILCRTYYIFSKLWIVNLNMIRKIVYIAKILSSNTIKL